MPLLTGFPFASGGGSGIVASGGTKTTDGNYSVHTFTSSGTFTVTANPNSESFDILCVGGGEGGVAGYDFGNPTNFARPGNGGQGGGVMFDVRKLTATSYTVTIGAAGIGANSGNSYQNTSGGTTTFDSLLTAQGGGVQSRGANLSYRNTSGYNNGQSVDSTQVQNGAAGQQGYSGSITGTATTYIGGGGAGAAGGGSGGGTGGSGGGVAGNGGNGNDQSGANATGYGGGGGGGGANYLLRNAFVSNGGNGSAGVVIIRYRS